jgi:hypothetical protein
MTKHAGVTSVKLGFSFASNCASMTDLIARSVNRSKTADMRCSPRLLLTIPTHLLPPLRWLVRVGVVIIFCPPLLLAREEEFKKLVVLQVNIFNALFYPSFSQNLSSLFLFLSLCVRGKNNNAVSLSLSIYLSIYLFTRVVASSTMIFFLTARTNEAHTHTHRTTTTTTTVRSFVRSLGNSSSSRFRRLHADSLSLFLHEKKTKKKLTESSNSNLSLSLPSSLFLSSIYFEFDLDARFFPRSHSRDRFRRNTEGARRAWISSKRRGIEDALF